MKPCGGGEPAPGHLLDMIIKDFGSFAEFRKEFTAAANTAFGSGWAWLVQTPSGLKVCILVHSHAISYVYTALFLFRMFLFLGGDLM